MYRLFFLPILAVALLLTVSQARAQWFGDEDNTRYCVVVNYEEQYSIWPADRESPLGWNLAGFCGAKAECLAYIEEVWTDMRPLSLRIKICQAACPESDEACRLRCVP